VPGDIAALRALRATLGAGGFLLVVVVLTAVVLIVVRLLRRRGGHGGALAAGLVVVLAVWISLAGIAELTLFGTQGLGADPRVALDPIVGARGWSGIAWRPVVDNVTLFVPLGAGLAALWCRRSWLAVLVVASLVSVGVEAFQWAFPTGRIANTADIIANSVGAGLGIMLARTLGACPREDLREANLR
jgi:Na+/melibiose symporter-like transporter